ncbi:hypothetical protein L917_08776, partial [Phytophthora nicotianae]
LTSFRVIPPQAKHGLDRLARLPNNRFPIRPKQQRCTAEGRGEQWESAEQEQERREQQHRRIANWRKQKKKRMSALSDTRQQLEKTLQLRVDAARVATDRVTP